MGLFGFGTNYNKPGPGVEKDEIPKAAPARYFEILVRKFTKLVQVNLLFFVPFIIAFGLSLLIFIIPFPYKVIQLQSESGIIQMDLWLIYLCPIPFIFLSPFISGMTIITRNFVREEHAFIWSDFIKTTKSNIKFSLLNGVICYVAYVLLSFSIVFYYSQTENSWLFYIPLFLCLIFALLFVFAQYYITTMIITFELSFKNIYKNAFIFALLGLGRNLLLTVLISALIVAAIYIPLEYLFLILLVLCPFIVFAFLSFTINFATYPVIKKYLIDPYNKQQSGDAEDSNKEDKTFTFNDSFDDDDDPDGYVYVNGRLIRKSEINNE